MTLAIKIAKMLAAGVPAKAIALHVGCSRDYVKTVRKRLRRRSETGSGKSPTERTSRAKRYAERYHGDPAFHAAELERFRTRARY